MNTKHAQGGMSAQDFAAKVESGLPRSLRKYTKVKAVKSVGEMVVQIDFAYTESTSHVDMLNAPSVRILVQGWPKDKVSASSVRSNKVPKFRKKSGEPAKVAQYLINWFKKNEKDLLEGEPYKKKAGALRIAKLASQLETMSKDAATLSGPLDRAMFENLKKAYDAGAESVKSASEAEIRDIGAELISASRELKQAVTKLDPATWSRLPKVRIGNVASALWEVAYWSGAYNSGVTR